MTEATPPTHPTTSTATPAAVEPTLKGAASTAVAAVESDFKAVVLTAKAYAVAFGAGAFIGAILGHLVK
jgi:hypothetical protein